MAQVDTNLFAVEAKPVTKHQSEQLLSQWVATYSWDAIQKELLNLQKHRNSTDDVLKFLAAPARLEFLTALSIKSKLPQVRVVPNYQCDDTGLPTSTAGGNMGDIECYEQAHGILVEVTMSEGRTQTMMEIWPIERHLNDFIEREQLPSQALFIAPSIYADSQRQIEFVRFSSQRIIRPLAIDQFILFLDTAAALYVDA